MKTITASQAIRKYRYAITRTLDEFLPEPLTAVDGIFVSLEQAQARLAVLNSSRLTGTFEIVRITHDGEVV